MYLLDTNIWLERLLNQQKSDPVKALLNKFSSELFFITDFTLHSIGIILHRLHHTKLLRIFIQDTFIEGNVNLVQLFPQDILDVLEVQEKFQLDFDDAYQYVAADKYNLKLVSFDSDFKRTPKACLDPEEILKT